MRQDRFSFSLFSPSYHMSTFGNLQRELEPCIQEILPWLLFSQPFQVSFLLFLLGETFRQVACPCRHPQLRHADSCISWTTRFRYLYKIPFHQSDLYVV